MMDATKTDDDPMTRILVEVTLGKAPAKPDTAMQAAFRRELQREVEQIRRNGGGVEVPSELP